MEEVWREEGSSPARVEAALRAATRRRGGEDESRPLMAPARVLNLVVIVDADRRGEIDTRLRGVGRLYPSRLIVCAVQEGRPRVAVRGGVGADDARRARGGVALTYERAEITLGASHLATLDTIVDLLLAPELTTMVWSPHGHDDGVDALRRLSQVVLIDSHDDPDAAAALARAGHLALDTYVVDLAWLRSTPWRERVAALFDPVDMRPGLEAITGVTVRHRADSRAAALLFAGWLATRLRWRPSRLSEQHGVLRGRLRAGARGVRIRLQTVDTEPPGLDGVTIEMEPGAAVSLDRAPGGLRTTHRRPPEPERVGTLLGASRGEPGILGEGVRQALLRDPTYGPALRSAQVMA